MIAPFMPYDPCTLFISEGKIITVHSNHNGAILGRGYDALPTNARGWLGILRF